MCVVDLCVSSLFFSHGSHFYYKRYAIWNVLVLKGPKWPMFIYQLFRYAFSIAFMITEQLNNYFIEYEEAIEKYLKREDWFMWGHMTKGTITLPIFQSLEAFWPGMQVKVFLIIMNLTWRWEKILQIIANGHSRHFN